MTCRSNRPGRSRAGSSTSGRLVAASTITDSVWLKPSISLRIWLSVCSRSSCRPPRPAPRMRPTASISSMNRIARRGLLGGLEHVADPAGADADEHLDELRAADREERHAGFAGHRPGQQRLAGARRPHQQHALGNVPAQALELLGVLQELDDLFQVVLHAFQAGHVGKGNRLLAVFVSLGGAFGKSAQNSAPHELVAGAAEHLIQQPPKKREQPPFRPPPLPFLLKNDNPPLPPPLPPPPAN